MEKAKKFLPLNTSLIENFLSKSDDALKDRSSSLKTSDLVNFSILEPDDPDFLYIQNSLNSKKFASLKEAKAISIALGSAIGDALGAPLESKIYKAEGYGVKGFEDFEDTKHRRVGLWTDDTAEALCLADSLLVNDLAFDPIDLRNRFFLWWFCGYNNGKKKEKDESNKVSIGIGGYTLNGFVAFLRNRTPFVEKKPVKLQSNSNGSIMRVAPIPIAFHFDINEALKFAGQQSFCTHDGEEASECCRLLTWLAIKGLNHPEIGFKVCREILDDLGKSFQSDLISIQHLAKSQKELDFTPYQDVFGNKTIDDRNWNWKDPEFKYSNYRIELKPTLIAIYSMDCVAMALHILYHNEGFKNCMIKAVNLGGDADSLGGVVGMLAGAFYGFNDEIKDFYKFVQQWDDNNEIAVKAYKLLNLRKSNQ